MKRNLSEFLSKITDRIMAVGNYDYCPWANKYVYWLKQPIGWFVLAAIASAVIGLFAVPQGWFVCGVVSLVTALGVAWPWLAMRGLTAEIEFDRRRCREQDSIQVTLVVTNRWPWAVWGLLVERGFFESAGEIQSETATTALASVSGWSKTQFTFEYVPPRRGVYPLQAPLLGTGFPFGLWQAHQPIALNEQLIVWPRCVDLKSLPLLQGERLSAVGAFVDRAGHDGDILSARDYREGDSLRRIHWTQTARRDRLIVCERQTASRQMIVVTLDPWAFADQTPQDRILLDWGLRTVASLCQEFHGHACDLSCELNDERQAVPAATAAIQQINDRLARYTPLPAAPKGSITVSTGDRAQMTLFVTTVAGWERLGRSSWLGEIASFHVIVLDPGSTPQNHGQTPPYDFNRAETPQSAVRSTKPWMWIDISEDTSQQLRHQWERQCHDNWSVN
ncbi:hypothetical protein CA54_58490 [Symmachiella macrocystis]|uniref:Uncharacterized protein n=1 Tax=Symmachiella macrocystis TaxID=2527985 RepID=A0A5C6B0R3_9PLAN|nr:DUF58 domain-containing protein [Symmachiella macrocystis]TWU05161.1 hypothetical protein CA54_58490 [Symmachiella macrocystis]